MKQTIPTILFLFLFVHSGFSQWDVDSSYVKPDVKVKPSYANGTIAMGNGVFGIQLTGGISYDEVKSGYTAVQKNNPSITEDIKVGPGGGTGFEIYMGRKLNKVFRIGLHVGYQSASGTPEIKGATVRFSKFYLLPMMNLGIPIRTKNHLNIGLGSYISFANKYNIKPPPSSADPRIEVYYKPNAGIATHFTYEHSFAPAASFYTGLRFHWTTLVVDHVDVNGQQIILNSKVKSLFDNKNGGGVAFVLGLNFIF